MSASPDDLKGETVEIDADDEPDVIDTPDGCAGGLVDVGGEG